MATTEDNFHAPIASILDVIDELQKETTFYLQNPTAPVHGVPGEPPPKPPVAPVESGTNLRFEMGEEALSQHIDPPFIIWTLGDVNLASKKAERRDDNRRLFTQPVPRRDARLRPMTYKTAAQLVTAWCFGAHDSKETNPRRKTVRGSEKLMCALTWAIHHHWHGIVSLEGVRWVEIAGRTAMGYAYVIPFRVELALIRPEQLMVKARSVTIEHEFDPGPPSIPP